MRLFLIAGEPSGDLLGGALMAGLRSLCPDVAFDGVGGPEMADQGLVSRFPMDELSVMGLTEVLPRYPHLRRRMIDTAHAVVAAEPDALITIDAPDFCLRVARRVRAAAPRVRTVHYVAPSVWAWRPGRAAKMAEVIDQVLALLPFEPGYMEAAGMRCDFVGHPVAAAPRADRGEIAAFRAEAGLGEAPVLLVLPGSRGAEVGRLAPVFGPALERVCRARPDLRVVAAAAAPVADRVCDAARDWPGRPVILDPRGQDPETAAAEKRAAFAAADVALAASGTVALELAAAGTPMVTAYRPSWLTYQILARMTLIDTANLVNLVSDTRAVPEFLGPACTPDALAEAVLTTLAAPQLQSEALDRTMIALGRGGPPPGLRAARAVLDGLGATRGG
ncbi:lipid-A-disaccharide synthase [Rhodobacteraceae bacterium CCMM004]|nr:lipid-A-disaccharide synthase [Rhodobacteraceae bacterium CCMM004]